MKLIVAGDGDQKDAPSALGIAWEYLIEYVLLLVDDIEAFYRSIDINS